MLDNSKRFQWGAFIRLFISMIGLLLSFVGMVSFFTYGLINLSSGWFANIDIFSLFTMGWVLLLTFLLLLPAAWNSILRLQDRPVRRFLLKPGIRLPSLFLLILPLFLWAGDILSKQQDFIWLFCLPPLQILVMIIPVWWLFEFGRDGLNSSENGQSWDTISIGLVITLPAAIIVEMIFLSIIFLMLGVWLVSQPNIMQEFQVLIDEMVDPLIIVEMIEPVLLPYIQQPVVLIGIMAITAVIIPLMEELLKPLALWSYIHRQITGADGFVIGLLCGAVFGLIESLGMLSAPLGGEWLILVIGRMGTGILHSVTAALVGWGLASVWQGKSILWYFFAYLFAAFFHGLWNFTSLFMELGALLDLNMIKQTGWIDWYSQASPGILVGLCVLFFIILWGANHRLRQNGLISDEEISFQDMALD